MYNFSKLKHYKIKKNTFSGFVIIIYPGRKKDVQKDWLRWWAQIHIFFVNVTKMMWCQLDKRETWKAQDRAEMRTKVWWEKAGESDHA